jgi:hypothetical protein
LRNERVSRGKSRRAPEAHLPPERAGARQNGVLFCVVPRSFRPGFLEERQDAPLQNDLILQLKIARLFSQQNSPSALKATSIAWRLSLYLLLECPILQCARHWHIWHTWPQPVVGS